MKKLILTLILMFTFSVCSADFKDVISDGYNFGSEVVFTDIENVPWAHEAIEYFVKNGIIKQNFEQKLYPNQYITREEFVDILISAFGIYDESATCSFTDIKDEYYGCIATANKCGIVNGVSETEFGFGSNILRRDLCTMAYRMMEYLGNGIEVQHEITFEDAGNIPEYALQSVTNLTYMGIINGDNLNCFNPDNNTTRAEAYKIIYLLMLKNA